MNATLHRLARIFQAALPVEKIASVVAWAKEFAKLPGSALAESWNPDLTPWTCEPLERTDDGTPSMGAVLPIQSGKSAIGEAAICRQIACSTGGDIQYLWQNDIQADLRWNTRVEQILKACEPVMARASKDRHKWQTGLIVFPHCNFIMQGVNTNRAVASVSVRFQIAEEVHDQDGGWAPGKLAQAHGRLTAWWNSFAGVISNAGYDGDQLHKFFLAGTQQEWMVKCPGCGLYHALRTRWEDDKPHLGGLRYDGDKFRQPNGDYDYERLKSTIRYQMPCGYLVHDDAAERRRLSMTGRYSDGVIKVPDGVDVSKAILPRTYTCEAVSIDYISWLKLIKEKHEALKALKYGDPGPYSVYVRERECRFFKRGMQPVLQNIVLSTRKKDREGLPNRVVRFGAGDYQKGEAEKNELPHWWHIIADVAIEPDGRIHVLIVSEGKLTTDDNLVDVFKRHDVIPSCVILDSSWNSAHVYGLCLRHGYYAVKGEPTELFAGHPDGSRKVYSPPKPLHAMVNQPPKFPYQMHRGEQVPHPQEPMFIRYSKFGLLNRAAWLRSSPEVIFDVPADVSEEFLSHSEAWVLRKKIDPRTQSVIEVWTQVKDRDDLHICICYIALLMEDAGFIGGAFFNENGKAKEEVKQ